MKSTISVSTNAANFNQPITIPSGVKGYACLREFLCNAVKFNNTLTLPNNLDGDRCLSDFLKNCHAMKSTISVSTNAANKANGNIYTLGDETLNRPNAMSPILITGTGATIFINKFQTSLQIPYRLLNAIST
jgi:hypothetical protein